MYLVLIETSGNQNYIFSTNKLKENIGASELTYRAGTSWVVEAIDQVRGASESINQVGRWLEEAINYKISTDDLRKKLLDEEDWNKPIELENENTKVETIIATSGKALLLTKEKEVAKSIIRYVTHKATKYAPGLDICGVMSDEFEWGEGLSQAVNEIYKKHEEHRSRKTSLNLRFLRLPVFDECATSGLPASINKDNISGKYISKVSAAKQNIGEAALARLALLLDEDKRQIRFAKNIRELNTEFEYQLNWLAIIHADGNGLGQIFLKFSKYINNLKKDEINNDSEDRKYVKALRKFSINLDICTENAFLKAIDAFIYKSKKNRDPRNQEKNLIPIIPLILGGDDLTVVCDGESALDFIQQFLQNFEKETSQTDVISEVADSAFNVKRLSACAGVAIIKPHFPFSVAYDLSESLIKSAKKVKDIVKDKSGEDEKLYPCSALDFHVLYDTNAIDLDQIRKKLTIKEQSKLFARPYIVTPEEDLQEISEESKNWVRVHRWESLQKRVNALKAEDKNDSNKLKLPNSQIHALREALFLGREAAEARYQLIRDRYSKKGIADLEFEHHAEHLFCQELETEIYITGLLDAIEAAAFLNTQKLQTNE